MKKAIITALAAVLLLVIFALPSLAGETEWDGYKWGKLSEDSKLYYIIGYADGMTRILAPIDYLLSLEDERFGDREKKGVGFVYDLYIDDFPWDFWYSQVSEGVNHFYNDSQNKIILIPDAIRIVSMQLRGETEEKINLEIETLRKDFEKKDQE